jgi:hypothetical protein
LARGVGLLVAAALAAGAAAREARPLALPFIENDQQTALARAKAAARPIFVEVWAPW